MVRTLLRIALANLHCWPGCGRVTAQAPRQDAQARRVGDRMKALQREAEQLATQSKTLLGDLRQLEIERDLRTEEARQAETAATAAQQSLVATSARVTELEQRATRNCQTSVASSSIFTSGVAAATPNCCSGPATFATFRGRLVRSRHSQLSTSVDCPNIARHSTPCEPSGRRSSGRRTNCARDNSRRSRRVPPPSVRLPRAPP